MKQNPYESPSANKEQAGDTNESASGPITFIKGGLGCLTTTLIFGILSAMLGGGFSMYAGTPRVFYGGKININLAGVVIVFLIGGFAWLAIANRRRNSR